MDEKFEIFYNTILNKYSNKLKRYKNKSFNAIKLVIGISIYLILIILLLCITVTNNDKSHIALLVVLGVIVVSIIAMLIYISYKIMNTGEDKTPIKMTDVLNCIYGDMLKSFNKTVEYDYSKGIGINIDSYMQSYDRNLFSSESEDMIEGKIDQESFKIIQLKTYDRKLKKVWDPTLRIYSKEQVQELLFSGVYGEITLEKNSDIKLRLEGIKNSTGGREALPEFYSKTGNTEFDKSFVAYANNQENFSRLLNEKNINKLLVLHKEIKHDYEFYFRENKISFRIDMGEICELGFLINDKQFKASLYKNYKKLEEIFKVMEVLIQIVEEA